MIDTSSPDRGLERQQEGQSEPMPNKPALPESLVKLYEDSQEIARRDAMVAAVNTEGDYLLMLAELGDVISNGKLYTSIKLREMFSAKKAGVAVNMPSVHGLNKKAEEILAKRL